MAKDNVAQNEKVHNTLKGLLHEFETGNIPEAIARVTFPPFIVPSNKWSLSNRIIMLLSGTSDARGFQQWKEAGRSVNKGSKSFCILGPSLVKSKKTKEDGSIEETMILIGFHPIPVFRAEDTNGQELEYQNIELPPLPLGEVAESWGIKVIPAAFQGGCMGYYTEAGGEKIVLCTPEVKTFFHELSHAAHKRILGKLKGGQDWKQEIVAELCASVLCRLTGSKENIGQSFQYISSYAKEAKKDVLTACVSVISDVEKCLTLIMSEHESIQIAA